MSARLKNCLIAALVGTAAPSAAEFHDPYRPPLYWSAYEYHIVRQQAEGSGPSSGTVDTSHNYIPESEFLANIDWVDANLRPLGYDMIAVDGWGDSLRLNENGYRLSHSQYWKHDYAWWSEYLRARGMRLGIYENPLFIHVQPTDMQTKIVGTDLNVSSLIDTSEEGIFQWVQVDRPGAEQYVKGYVEFYAAMGVDFLRIDFISWYENGYDHYIGRVGAERPREHYETALRWIREAADENAVYLSFAMPHLYNEAELERRYAHSIRISEDVDYGEWWKFSDKDRGHRYSDWSQWANALGGFTYWSYISGRNLVRLDGDFIRINTFDTDTEKRTVISGHLIAGGPVAVADRYDTIGDDLFVYQNAELLALNADGFVGRPLTHDGTNEQSQIWTGRMSNGDTIVALFNRELTPRTRSLAFADVGFPGPVTVRDLWQHAELGSMTSISVVLPPHGSMVLRLTGGESACLPQSITFTEIGDLVYGDPPPALSATSGSGLPVEFEVALGPATVEGGQVQPTGQSGTVHVLATQGGDAAWCAAIPEVQSFEITGGHQAAMYLGGTFTGWNASIELRLQGEVWIAEEVRIPAGNHQLKFANTKDWSGEDWGGASGLSGIAQPTTGGGPNIEISVPQPGFYRVSFNDFTLEYSFTAVNPGLY